MHAGPMASRCPHSPRGTSPKQGCLVSPLAQATCLLPSPSVRTGHPLGRGSGLVRALGVLEPKCFSKCQQLCTPPNHPLTL